jgi:hypothetical protein
MTDRRGFLRSLVGVPLLAKLGAGGGAGKAAVATFRPMKLTRASQFSHPAMTPMYFTKEQLGDVHISHDWGERFDAGVALGGELLEGVENHPMDKVEGHSPAPERSDPCPSTNTHVILATPPSTLVSRFETSRS